MREWQTKIDNTAPNDTGVLGAAEDNARGKELENAVETAGITADSYNAASDTDLFMLAQAMARYASGGIFGEDGGAANAYVVSTPLSFIMPKAYFSGMMVEFYPANTNSGASTVNAFGIGSKKILGPGGIALTGGELVEGQLTALVYDPSLDSGTGAFQIKPWASVSAGETSNYKNLPIFPQIEETDNKLTVSNLGGGSLQIAAGQSFLWRGWTRIDTDDFSSGDRTLSTSSSKTYHIRWHAPGTGDATPESSYPNGRFRIKDLADAGYNPSSLAETNAAFDSSYDNMLIAKVVTDGSNIATVSALANKDQLTDQIQNIGTATSNSKANAASRTVATTYNWARTPASWTWQWVHMETHGSDTGFAASDAHDHDVSVGSTAVSRYGLSFTLMRDYAHEMNVNLILNA